MKVLAVLMIAIGALMAGLSGLCTAAVSLAAFASMFSRYPGNAFPGLLIGLVIGAPFIVGGILLLRWGLRLLDRRRPPRIPPEGVF